MPRSPESTVPGESQGTVPCAPSCWRAEAVRPEPGVCASAAGQPPPTSPYIPPRLRSQSGRLSLKNKFEGTTQKFITRALKGKTKQNKECRRNEDKMADTSRDAARKTHSESSQPSPRPLVLPSSRPPWGGWGGATAVLPSSLGRAARRQARHWSNTPQAQKAPSASTRD